MISMNKFSVTGMGLLLLATTVVQAELIMRINVQRSDVDDITTFNYYAQGNYFQNQTINISDQLTRHQSADLNLFKVNYSQANEIYKEVGLRREIKLGKNFRIAPLGNSTKHPVGRFPHYHRRGKANDKGQTPPGQGIGRHRPWERSPHDTNWWSRF